MAACKGLEKIIIPVNLGNPSAHFSYGLQSFAKKAGERYNLSPEIKNLNPI